MTDDQYQGLRLLLCILGGGHIALLLIIAIRLDYIRDDLKKWRGQK